MWNSVSLWASVLQHFFVSLATPNPTPVKGCIGASICQRAGGYIAANAVTFRLIPGSVYTEMNSIETLFLRVDWTPSGTYMCPIVRPVLRSVSIVLLASFVASTAPLPHSIRCRPERNEWRTGEGGQERDKARALEVRNLALRRPHCIAESYRGETGRRRGGNDVVELLRSLRFMKFPAERRSAECVGENVPGILTTKRWQTFPHPCLSTPLVFNSLEIAYLSTVFGDVPNDDEFGEHFSRVPPDFHEPLTLLAFQCVQEWMYNLTEPTNKRIGLLISSRNRCSANVCISAVRLKQTT